MFVRFQDKDNIDARYCNITNATISYTFVQKDSMYLHKKAIPAYQRIGKVNKRQLII